MSEPDCAVMHNSINMHTHTTSVEKYFLQKSPFKCLGCYTMALYYCRRNVTINTIGEMETEEVFVTLQPIMMPPTTRFDISPPDP